jgi:phospholipase C
MTSNIDQLEKIDHIAILMLENRSFDDLIVQHNGHDLPVQLLCGLR